MKNNAKSKAQHELKLLKRSIQLAQEHADKLTLEIGELEDDDITIIVNLPDCPEEPGYDAAGGDEFGDYNEKP